MPRMARDELFMRIAFLMAERSTCNRASVGAVIVGEGRIISTGYNGSPPGEPHCLDVGCLTGADGGCKRTTHAELNAIVFAARNGISPDGGTIYCTHQPCRVCGMAIMAAGIERVVFAIPYRDAFSFPLEVGTYQLPTIAFSKYVNP